MTGYRISTNIDEMDITVIHSYLSQSYWAKGIPRDCLWKGMQNSLCFGVFTVEAQQVGFARLISDFATYAYLADVFVITEHRGKGLSKRLMSEIMAHPQLQGLRRMSLVTRDAHTLYTQYGFTALNNPNAYMEYWRPDIYQQ